jgi:F0F1-type ATP synthase delta subunit
MEHLKLPPTVIGEAEVARLLRELNQLDDFFVSAKARTAGTAMQLPKLSRLLDQLARENSINLLDEPARGQLAEALKQVQAQAPKVHLSFAAEPSVQGLDKILGWLRQNIHPQTLVQVGLQPSIAAGCILRTPNKIFDMSLRTNLKQKQTYLTQLIAGAVDGR